jgi:serine/threonine protein kinase
MDRAWTAHGRVCCRFCVHRDLKPGNVALDRKYIDWRDRLAVGKGINIGKELMDANTGDGFDCLETKVLDLGHGALRGGNTVYTVAAKSDSVM